MKRTLMAFLLLGGLALAQADGAKIYAQCAGCHQQNGQGIPGAFPPLAGHVAEILAKEGGREYLILVLLYGLQGQIEVKGFKPFTAEEVKKLRAKKLTPQQVLAERKKLGLK